MNRNYRTFCHHFEISVGHDHRYFDDAIAIRLQSGHFHVDPDKAIRVLCHNFSLRKQMRIVA